MPCPRLEDNTFFDSLKMGYGNDLIFSFKNPQNFAELLRFFCTQNNRKFANHKLEKLYPWPWSRPFLSLASKGSVLEKLVLGLERRVLDSISDFYFQFICQQAVGYVTCVAYHRD